MSSTDMLGTTGYGLWDTGRAKLEQIFAEVMGAEDALVRSQFQSGTHTLAVALFGLLRAGDTLLAATGRPYDTLEGVIGIGEAGKGCGTLQEYGIHYDEVPLLPDFTPDYAAIAEHAKTATVVHIQRSRGYTQRNAFDLDTIQKVADTACKANPDVVIFVDNCYGEFIEKQEPTEVGADLIAGSLIKNMGGGFAPTGGYIAGRADLVELASYRLTAPGLGGEMGATLGDTAREFYQGLFIAPHVVTQAVKTAIFASAVFKNLGYAVKPLPEEVRSDIIQAIRLETREKLCNFCVAIQTNSPVDAHVEPVPAMIPGYQDEIIMAAGTFVQGASIELSADGPCREPYNVYFQGGLTFEHGRIAIMSAARMVGPKE